MKLRDVEFTGKINFMRIKEQSGFTLVELLVVIAIIGILVAIVVVAINPQRLIQDARDSKKRQELQQVKNSLQLYHNDNQDYPTTAEFNPGCVAPCINFIPTYMRQLPTVFTDATPTAFYTNVPPGAPGEYRAGVILDNPDDPANNDDDDTRDKCDQPAGSIPGGVGTWDDADYFICPD